MAASDQLNRNDNDETAEKPKHMVRQLLLALSVILTIPFILFFGLFPLLLGKPFETIDELNPDDISQIEVRLYNRVELDGGDDVGPYIASRNDYEKLLSPLLGVQEVPQYDGARGPWLGEYRILLKNGRKGTVRFFWVPPKDETTMFATLSSVMGTNSATNAMTQGLVTKPAPQLRFEIGLRKYVAGTTTDLIRACSRGETTGQKRTRR